MTQSLPLIPLRDVVVYPHMVIPLFVGRQNSIDALEHAMAADKAIVVVAQKSATVDDPKVEDLFEVGTSARILQLLKLPDGTVKVLVEGEQRVKIKQVDETEGFFTASVLTIDDAEPSEGERKALAHTLMAQFEHDQRQNNQNHSFSCIYVLHTGSLSKSDHPRNDDKQEDSEGPHSQKPKARP